MAKLYVNSLLSTLNARAFAKNSRYTMHSSAIRGVGGGNNVLSKAEMGGATRSTSSGKGFNPVSSNSEVTAVNDQAGKKPSFLKAFGGVGANRFQEKKQDGIHVVTIEERYESNLPDNVDALPYTASGRGPRTPGESRKSSENSEEENNFGVTQESLAMSAISNRSPTVPLNVAPAPNHPYNRY